MSEIDELRERYNRLTAACKTLQSGATSKPIVTSAAGNLDSNGFTQAGLRDWRQTTYSDMPCAVRHDSTSGRSSCWTNGATRKSGRDSETGSACYSGLH